MRDARHERRETPLTCARLRVHGASTNQLVISALFAKVSHSPFFSDNLLTVAVG